jgi:hypothetical protein
MTWPRNKNHVEVMFFDEAVEVRIDEVLSWRSSPVAEQHFLHVRKLERLAQKHAPSGRRPHGVEWWEQTIFCHAPKPSVRDVDAPQERYCAKRRDERAAILHAYHALQRVDALSGAVLIALYGNRPPGMPAEGTWKGKGPESDDEQYRRVCRYVAGSGAEVDALCRVDLAELALRDGESAAARKVRAAQAVTHATAARGERLREIAAECERLIVAASHAYRAAWKAVG